MTAATLGGFTTGKEGLFGRQHRTAALFHDTLALGTGATAATSAGKEQVGIGEGLQQLATRGHLNGPLSVDFDTDIPAGNQSAAGGKNHNTNARMIAVNMPAP